MNKSFLKISAMLLAVMLTITSCELLDGIVEPPINQDLTEEAVLGVAGSGQQVLNGVERQAALYLNEILPISEIASDNYTNTRTFYNQFLDRLDIDFTDDDLEDTHFDLARMSELALFGLNIILPGDPAADAVVEGELRFYSGYARLAMAEIFGDLPGEPNGPVVSEEAHLQAAIAEFQAVVNLAGAGSFAKTSSLVGLARAYRLLGDRDNAANFAEQAIAEGPDHLREIQFDFNNGPTSNMQNALYDRGTFDDLQPLPRLDFLDPKYSLIGGTAESPAALVKIEEAHLILCEAQIAQNSLADAQQTMKDIIGLVATRRTLSLDDNREGRTHNAPGSRPDSTDVVVKASETDMERAGLVLDRQGDNIVVPVVSGTSVTEAMVDAIASQDEAYEVLYLMRQEIFMAEGRRMTDLGIRFVVSFVEVQNNPNVSEGDAATTASLPAYIDAIKAELDDITYDPAASPRVCTIKHNLNAILVANKSEALPFE
ncbi:MAG: hypothetical protein AAFQ83_00350 [Bacteroidota bacterium]